MLNLFDEKTLNDTLQRIDKLNATTKPHWGKMNSAQMLAHCSVAYEFVYEPERFPPLKGFPKFLVKVFVKDAVVGEKPYKRNSRTAPEFLIKDEKDFKSEKERLINYLRKTQELGEAHFHNKESRSFGPLTKTEWNIMFAKHLDHHLTQFGV